MLKQKIIICAFMCLVSCSYAQLVRSYSETIAIEFIDDFTTECIIEFFLYRDGKYELRLNKTFSAPPICAQILYYGISEGKYKLRKNTLFFTDSYTHHQFVYQFDSIYLRPVKTYSFLMDKVFIDDGDRTSLEQKDYRENEIPVKKTLTNLKKKKSQKIIEGTYFFWDFQFVLNKGNQFELSFNKGTLNPLDKQSELNLLFFTGKWKQKGNKLILSDTNFQHKFYGLIREDGIELFVFPIEDVVFRREWD